MVGFGKKIFWGAVLAGKVPYNNRQIFVRFQLVKEDE
jgi:hypothetical protein